MTPLQLTMATLRFSNRTLTTLLAALLAVYMSLLSLFTQPPDEAINLLLVLGGALLVLPGFSADWQPRPGRRGRWVGVTLLVAVLWRGQRMMGFDFVSSLLPLLGGVGLALLVVPARQLRLFVKPFGVLAFLPVMRAVGWLMPLEPLSLATAWLTQQLLMISGFTVQRFGTVLRLSGGGVVVGGPCAGLNMLLQLLAIAVIFAIAVPMRHRWQNGLMIVVAPLLALIVNGMRIAVLALINASNWSNKTWWFDFFHWHWGSLVFAGVAMQLFVWLYLYWMTRQLAALPSR